MPRRADRAAACAAAVVALLGAAAAQAASPGVLVQLRGSAGCVADRSHVKSTCARARGLRGPAPFQGSNGIAVSPDGRNVYVAASRSDAVAVFRRSASTGLLRQLRGTQGCIADGGGGGCTAGIALDKPNSVAVSADGRNVYVTAANSNAVAMLNRDPATGALTQAADGSGCVTGTALAGCATGRAVAMADAVAVSADGRNVYVASFAAGAVASFARDAGTGALTQAAGAAGCIEQDAAEGCAAGFALGGAEGLTVSPDGTAVYVAAATANALVALTRDPGDGTLTQATDGTGCLGDAAVAGCSAGRVLTGANAVAVGAPHSVYVTSLFSDSLTTFAPGDGGALAQLAGTEGCVQFLLAGGCSLGHGLDAPEAVAVSPDGASVYVGAFGSSAVDTFDRDPDYGGLMQKSKRAGCIAARPSRLCRRGRGLRRVGGLTVSPDGRNVYAAGFGSDSVAVFRRVGA